MIHTGAICPVVVMVVVVVVCVCVCGGGGRRQGSIDISAVEEDFSPSEIKS